MDDDCTWTILFPAPGRMCLPEPSGNLILVREDVKAALYDSFCISKREAHHTVGFSLQWCCKVLVLDLMHISPTYRAQTESFETYIPADLAKYALSLMADHNMHVR